MSFDQRVIDEVQQTCEKLRSSGKLIPRELLEQYYETFRNRFSPERLKALDGEELLETLHNHSNHDSLAYWLEFKSDDEFPSTRFGSIAGGSALKFIIYRRRETGEWMTGSSRKQRALATDEAIQFARKHRDQFVQGAAVLERFPTDANEGDYDRLESELAQVAPDISPLAWGHKYFHLLFPDRLDDFHSPIWQRFNIIKLLRVPPDGRYRAAYHFVELAKTLELPMWWLTSSLNARHGRPHAYWRLGIRDDNEKRPPLNLLRNNRCIGIGWDRLGDLSLLQDEAKIGKAATIVKGLLSQHYPDDSSRHTAQSRQIASFAHAVTERDIVVLMNGPTVVGICRIAGDYFYQKNEKFPHRRPVEWLSEAKWELKANEHTQRTFSGFGKSPQNLVEVEKRILGIHTTNGPVNRRPRFPGIPGRIQSVLERKSQVILYGPPGTGKTFWAERTARDLAAHDAFGVSFDQLDPQQKSTVTGDGQDKPGRVRLCCFHPAYGYEDFLEGYRPEQNDGKLAFALRPGIFRQICEDAEREPDARFYLIIDEINRGDIPRIFGELMTVLEKNKRGTKLLLPLTGQPFHIPHNVRLIGTMNTADRSIALLDTALRRRFGFIELMPDSSVLGNAVVEGIPLGPWLDALNARICEHIGRDARNLQIGHAYLMDGGRPIVAFAKLARVVQDDIIPLLEEYCYEDHSILERILGKGLVDGDKQLVHHDLFLPERQDELVEALRSECPEITATTQAVESDTEDEPDDDQGEEGDADDTAENG